MELSNKSLIEINNIGKIYNGKTVLSNISTKFSEGKFYTLLGHNGAGKSTLLRVISGYEYASSGTGSIFDCSINKDLGEKRALLGIISEDINFNLPIALNKFIDMYASQFPNWNQKLFETLIDRQKIDLSKKFTEFSRGQKMQIVFIVTISTSPKIMLIDEITSVLDVYSRLYFIELLRDFVTKGGTIIMTTNIINEIQNYCTDTIILKDGKILIDSPLDKILSDFIKIRKTKENKNDTIFNHPELFSVSINSDRSESYLIKKEFSNEMNLQAVTDKRAITLQELFLFYTQKKLTTANQKIEEA